MPATRRAPSGPGIRAVRRPARGQGGADLGDAELSGADDAGAAAVELAIVLPVLLLLIFGMIDFGRAMNQQIVLTEAVREGARVGALSGTVAAVKSQVSSTVGTGVTLSYPTAVVCGSTPTAGADATVTASYPFTPVTPVFPVLGLFGVSAGSITLSATGVMSCMG